MARLLLLVLLLTGCYRSHVRSERDGGTTTDAAIPDAAHVDAPDSGPLRCDALAVTGSTSLDEGVTPRLVALPGGDVGIVYVRTDGDPSRVIYERLDRTLTRITGPVTIGTDSFTWAEVVSTGSDLRIAYGVAGSSVLAPVSFDGAPTGARVSVPLFHPSILDRAGADFLWVTFAMEVENALDLTHVTPAGEVLRDTQTIPLGRYGSGHHAARRGDGHVLAYPREGPPGMRHGYVRAVAPDGELGPERQLDPVDADRNVTPVTFENGTLVVVRDTGDALVVEPTDAESLERLARFDYPPLDGSPIAGSLAGRLLVAHPSSGVLQWDYFAADLSMGDRYEIPMPHPGLGSGTSIVEQPGAVVIAMGLTNAGMAVPWVVRIECTD